MCGLTGFLLQKQSLNIAELENRLSLMVETIGYRGPDDQGVWTDGKVGLGFARLSIIDLSTAGHQPMTVEDRSVWLTFNGEIYNFHDIRTELENLGHSFRGRSDSEVILRGYIEWGDEILHRLRGMFAIALWDGRKNRLMLARDRIGKKPLMYMCSDEGLFFGSEIKTILAWPGVQREPDFTAIHQFLTYQYVPTPRTAFKGVKKLPAGHKMIVQLDLNGKIASSRIECYWRLCKPRARYSSSNLTELSDELVSQLDEAVKIRMVSDVPLGAFLSGGVDSSAIVAMMARHSNQSIKTFSIGFENDEYDETQYAKMVADRYNTDHHVFVVKPNAIEILPKLVHHYNEPFADPSAVPSFYLAKLAKQHVTVALNGDGGDEAFMGYGRYRSMEEVSRFDGFPRSIRNLGSSLIKNLPIPGWKKKRRRRFAESLLVDSQPPQHRYAFSITAFGDEHKTQAYAEAMRSHLADSALDLLSPYFGDAEDLVTGANWADIHVYLPDDLMVKVDIATMAHSLESRSPLLDHVFLEWALTLPKNIVLNQQNTKAIFKKAMEPYLPQEVLYRPKMGFGCPVDHWFRNELKEIAYDSLLSEKFLSRKIINEHFVKSLLDEHCYENKDHSTRLWPLLMLELWFQMWIDN